MHRSVTGDSSNPFGLPERRQRDSRVRETKQLVPGERVSTSSTALTGFALFIAWCDILSDGQSNHACHGAQGYWRWVWCHKAQRVGNLLI